MSWVTPVTILNDSSIAARTSAQLSLMQQSHMAWNTIAYLWRQNVTLIEPDKCHVATQHPPELYHLVGPALLVVCSLHLPKIIEFYLRIQMLPAKL